MNDRLTSILRTAVPAGWSLLITWLVGTGWLSWLPAGWETWARGLGDQVASAAILVALYVFARWVEPHLPDWLTRVLLGSAKQPTYNGAVSDPGDASPASGP